MMVDCNGNLILKAAVTAMPTPVDCYTSLPALNKVLFLVDL